MKRAAAVRLALLVFALPLASSLVSCASDGVTVSGSMYYGAGYYDPWYYGPGYRPPIIVGPPVGPPPRPPRPPPRPHPRPMPR